MANTPPLQDRLQKARALRTTKFTVAGTELDLHKWTLDQSLVHGALVFEVIRDLVNGPQENLLANLIKIEPKALLENYGAKIKTMLIDTVREGNFANLADAAEWIGVLGSEQILELALEIWRQNLRPFADRLGVSLPKTPSAAVEPKPLT
jgi:hypothetical protein